MTEAVIVSTARTPLAKSWKGAFNMTHGATLGGHAVKAAVERAGIDPAEVDDVLMGCANPEGATGANIARQIALRAGLPVTRQRHDRQPLLLERPADHRDGRAAHHRRRGRHLRGRRRGEHLLRAAGDEQAHDRRHLAGASTSPRSTGTCCRPPSRWPSATTSPSERMDDYGAASQQKACAAQEAGKFKDEIAPITVDRRRGRCACSACARKEVTVSADEGLRPGTTYEGIKDIRRRCPAA